MGCCYSYDESSGVFVFLIGDSGIAMFFVDGVTFKCICNFIGNGEIGNDETGLY